MTRIVIAKRFLEAACMVAGLAALSPARATEVELELDAGVAWPGTTVGLKVKVINPTENISTPEIPSVSGLSIRGPAGTMRSTQRDENGRASDALIVSYQVTPQSGRKGKFTIGPVTVRTQSGTVLKSNVVELAVSEEPPIGVLMDTQITPAGGPVGSPFRVVYTVYYYRDTPESGDSFFGSRKSLGLTRLELPAASIPGAKVVPVPAVDGEEAQQLQISKELQVFLQQGGAEKNGKGYLTYSFGFEVTPLAPGPIELGGARCAMRLLTGGTAVGRNAFGQRVRVPEDKEFTAESPSTVYQVRALPTEGRPPGFNGAVGKYQISVTASPTEVDEGAPITLEVRVTGKGLLESLKPPIWTEIESLAKDFQVSGDVDAGKVEQNAKVFRQLLRPTNARVTAIPPVPFPFFDPASSKYQVALSQPIPIKVRAVETAVVDTGIQAAQPKATAVVNSQATQAPTIVERGGVGANFDSIGVAHPALDPRDEVLSAPFLAGVIAPPLAFLGLALGLKLRRRDPALKRKSQALARATTALSATSDARAIAQILDAYFRDRLGLPPGEVTQADVTAALERTGAPVTTRLGAAGLIEKAHAARFGASGNDAAFADEAGRLLREVEACLRG